VRVILREVRENGGPAGGLSGLREVPSANAGGADDLSLGTLERAAVKEALNRADGNRRKAAEALGISERTLYRKIKEYGLS
jgi:transcriptional regulator with PAS, ATPase and Fis domain